MDIKTGSARISLVGFLLIALSFIGCNTSRSRVARSDGQAGLKYLRTLKGKWIEKGDKKSPLGWEFDYTPSGMVVVELLKVGNPTELSTTYNLDGANLYANHYYGDLPNPIRLNAVNSKDDADLYFLCDGDLGKTKSHAELHMHGVHYKKKGDELIIRMDMFENNKIAFKTTYELIRVK